MPSRLVAVGLCAFLAGSALPAGAQSLVETPVCEQAGAFCEADFGRWQLRIPRDMIRYPMVRVTARAGDEPTFYAGTLRTTWQRLGGMPGAAEAVVQISLSTRSLPANLDQALDNRMRYSWSERRPTIEQARAQGDAKVLFNDDRNGQEERTEIVFRNGRAATMQVCQRIVAYGSPGICRISLHNGLVGSFWFDRSVDPSTEEITARVLDLVNSLIVDGPRP